MRLVAENRCNGQVLNFVLNRPDSDVSLHSWSRLGKQFSSYQGGSPITIMKAFDPTNRFLSLFAQMRVSLQLLKLGKVERCGEVVVADAESVFELFV